MKTNLLLLFCVLLFNTSYSQKKLKDVKIPEYQLEFIFNGEVNSEMDSAFSIFCVFDESEIKNFKNFEIKTGMRKDNIKSEIISVDNSTHMYKKNKKVYYEIANLNKETEIVEIYFRDNHGVSRKSIYKNN